MIAWEGTFRIYYNSVKDAPMVWNIDDGEENQQICIETWFIRGAHCYGICVPEAEYPYPKALLTGKGNVIITGGQAVISPYVPKV